MLTMVRLRASKVWVSALILEVNEAASEIEVGVGDGARGIIGRDKAVHDVLWPFKESQHGNVGLSVLPMLESVVWKPNFASAFTQGVMVVLFGWSQQNELGDASGPRGGVLDNPLETGEELGGLPY